MKNIFAVVLLIVAVASCDDSRFYEKYYDFENRLWMVDVKPEFDFLIHDTTQAYNVYCNVRNSVSYPYSRIFITYYLEDSTGASSKKSLLQYTLFDPKTGEPMGTSGLGDLYDHQIPLIRNHRFPYKGHHKIRFEQYMRKDTLEGILAVGLRIEKAISE